MGCYNGTCMISNLPIVYDEPVVGYVIADPNQKYQRDYYNGMCHPDNLFTPIGLPLRGIYNDYGSIENIDDNNIATKYLLNLFNESSSDSLLKGIGSGDIKLDNGLSVLLNVGLIMINEHIFDRLTDNPNKYETSIDTITTELKDIRDFEKRRKEIYKQFNNNTISAEDNNKLCGLVSPAMQLGIHCNGLSSVDYDRMIRFIISLDDNKENAEEFAELLCQDRMIRDMMYSLRKVWIPPSGAGSQNINYRSHLVLTDAIKEHIFNSFDGPEDAYPVLLGERDW